MEKTGPIKKFLDWFGSKTPAVKYGTGAGVAVIVLSVAALIVWNTGKEDSYRNIKIMELSGAVTVTREKTKDTEAYENMNMQSGDLLKTGPDSFARLVMDEDKYVFVEQNSEVLFILSGTGQDSGTRLELSKGAVVSELENGLSGGSSYEVTTPSSVMAVRGTRFRVAIEKGEDGKDYVKLTVLEGKVGSRLIDKKGDVAEEEVMTDAGREILILDDGSIVEYVLPDREINYGKLPEQVLKYFYDRTQQGVVFDSITEEELYALLYPEPSKEEPDAGPEEPKKKEEQEIIKPSPEIPSANREEQPDSQKKEAADSGQTKEGEEENKAVKGGESTEKGSSGNPPADTPSTDTPSTDTPPADNPPADNPPADNPPADNPPADNPAPSAFTVTFLVDETVFATQSVPAGGTAQIPVLKPSPSGSWSPDAAVTVITQDTAFTWIP